MNQKSICAILEKGQQLGITISGDQMEQLNCYLEQCLLWRKRYNITGFKNEEEFVSQGILDAFHMLPYLAGKNILDIGSGAGLPGMIVAIMKKSARVTLTELRSKKLFFLKHAVRTSKLDERVRVIDARVEEFNDKFDCITCRAFSSIKDIMEHSRRYIKGNTRLVLPRAIRDLDECLKGGGNAIMYHLGDIKMPPHMLAIFRIEEYNH